MTQLPPIPEWSSLHPLIVHFPIALFLLLPLLLLGAAISRRTTNHALLVAAFALMMLATGFLCLTYFTGDAMAAASEGGPAVSAVIKHHCSLAGYTVSAFTLATTLFAVALLVRRVLRLEDMRDLTPWLLISFFVFYALGVFWLVLTAHHGASLAHELLRSSTGY
ncbi:MAG TPA: hypothetical protein VMT53_00425 [Terriglobales bacterium]|nr:hypothetical protein [Terriglobales bacterium]